MFLSAFEKKIINTVMQQKKFNKFMSKHYSNASFFNILKNSLK